MNRAIITQSQVPLRGTVSLPGDKSLSHRRALLSLFTPDEVVLENYSSGADGQSTLNCLAALGKTIQREQNRVAIRGPVNCQSAILDGGNSGTTVRLLMGILAGRSGEWTICGDDSLSRRPMERVADPLRKMGARIELTDGHLPARIVGSELHGIDYESPVSSAQVKSAVLFAAIQATGITRYGEPFASRDHTERLLGLSADSDGFLLVNPDNGPIRAQDLSGSVPGDPSAAAFFVAGAMLVPESEMELQDVLINPLRAAYLEILNKAGANIRIDNHRLIQREPVAEITVTHSAKSLSGFTLDATDTAACIDEIPILAVLAAHAQGQSVFRNLGELRVKESDRLRLIVENLSRLGANFESIGDDLQIGGSVGLKGAEIITEGDHRIAMAFGIAGLAARGPTVIDNADCAAVSDPAFWSELHRLNPDSVKLETKP